MTDQISAAEKANRRLHMESIQSVWALFNDHFGGDWSEPMADREIIKVWARSFYKYGRADLLSGANALIDQWQEKHIPAIPDFRKFVDVARRVREADEGNVNTPVGAAYKEKRKEFRKKYIELMKRIADSPTSREPSDEDVESFEYSYDNLNLEARYTGGIEMLIDT